MRLLHCADLHIGLGGQPQEGAAILERLVQAALLYHAEAMLICGDLFDRGAAGSACAEAAMEALRPAKQQGMRLLAVEGNHDCAFDKPKPTPLMHLQAMGGVTLLGPHMPGGAWLQAETAELTVRSGEGRAQGVSKRASSYVYGSIRRGGEPHLQPYDGESGAIFTLGTVRIVGLGYLGVATRRHLPALLGSLPPFSGSTVCMLHTGVYPEGIPLPPGGARPADMLHASRYVEYMALGHRHAREEGACWYNPGSPNSMRLKNRNAPHGYYLVDMEAGRVERTFVDMRA